MILSESWALSGLLPRSKEGSSDSLESVVGKGWITHLNRECLLWCENEALERKWPDDPGRTVAAAFQEEQKVLLPLPDIAVAVPRKITLRPDRYGYVHFDRNQYSVPLAVAGHVLTLWAYEDEVVIMDGQSEVARHCRSYDVGEQVAAAVHREEIDSYRNKPRISRHITRLAEEIPELLPLMSLWIEFHLDTRALVNFVRKALQLHGPRIMRLAIGHRMDSPVVCSTPHQLRDRLI